MNGTQVQTGSAAIVAGLAGYAFGHGWLGLSLTDWTTLIGAIFAGGAVVWPLVVTRVQALKDTVGKSGAVVVTNAASANALPNNPNVVTPSQVSPAVVAQAK